MNNNIIKIGLNLDLEPEKRYQCLLVHFDILSIKKEIQNLYKKYAPQIPGLDIILSITTYLTQYKIMYYDEIYYWSNIFEIPFHQAVLMQLLYEINSGCTTIIHTNDNEKQSMIRTFDWPEPLLTKLLYQASFYKNGKKIFEGICILGSVGIFTGKNDEYSLAINYRRTTDITLSTIFHNFLNTIKSYWPVSYLLRYCLEKSLSFDDCVNTLKNSLVISPVYYSINGFCHKPLIIQRSINSYKEFTGEYTIQTNCDQFDDVKEEKDIEYSYDRFFLAKKVIDNKGNKNENDMLKSLLKFPIKREDTIYISIINKEQFDTTIFFCKQNKQLSN